MPSMLVSKIQTGLVFEIGISVIISYNMVAFANKWHLLIDDWKCGGFTIYVRVVKYAPFTVPVKDK